MLPTNDNGTQTSARSIFSCCSSARRTTLRQDKANMTTTSTTNKRRLSSLGAKDKKTAMEGGAKNSKQRKSLVNNNNTLTQMDLDWINPTKATTCQATSLESAGAATNSKPRRKPLVNNNNNNNTLTQMGYIPSNAAFRNQAARVSFESIGRPSVSNNEQLKEEPVVVQHNEQQGENNCQAESRQDDNDVIENLAQSLSQTGLGQEESDDRMKENDDAIRVEHSLTTAAFQQRNHELPHLGDTVISCDVKFRKHETWKVPYGVIDGYLYFFIEGFTWVGGKKHAIVDHVFIDLKATFMGAKQAERLLEDPGWLEMNPKDPNMLEVLNKDEFFVHRRTIPLSELAEMGAKCYAKTKEEMPTPSFCYFETTSKKKGAHGYRVEYLHKYAKIRKRRLSHLPTSMDLFAGAGIAAYGSERAGFRVIAAIEKDPMAAANFKINFPHAEVHQVDVKDLFEAMKKVPGRPKADHLSGGSPCPGFSYANRNSNIVAGLTAKDLANNGLCFQYIEGLKLERPRTALFENVPGMMNETLSGPANGELQCNRDYLKKLMADHLISGYQPRLVVLDAMKYGDPQHRTRLFILGVSFGVPMGPLQVETHGDGQGLLPFVTVDVALKDCEAVEPTEKLGVKCQIQGVDVDDHYLLQETGKCVLERGKCAPTLKTGNPIGHYNGKLKRNITLCERRRLMSLPYKFQLYGSPMDRMRQIGNGVPVCLQTAVMSTLMWSHEHEFAPESPSSEASADMPTCLSPASTMHRL